MQFYFGWFGTPILLTGDYPQVMRSKVDQKSQAQGRFWIVYIYHLA